MSARPNASAGSNGSRTGNSKLKARWILTCTHFYKSGSVMKYALPDKTPVIAAPAVALQVHPWRSALYEELHNRPSPVIEGPCQVTHFTVVDRKSTRLNSSHVKISYAVF